MHSHDDPMDFSATNNRRFSLQHHDKRNNSYNNHSLVIPFTTLPKTINKARALYVIIIRWLVTLLRDAIRSMVIHLWIIIGKARKLMLQSMVFKQWLFNWSECSYNNVSVQSYYFSHWKAISRSNLLNLLLLVFFTLHY